MFLIFFCGKTQLNFHSANLKFQFFKTHNKLLFPFGKIEIHVFVHFFLIYYTHSKNEALDIFVYNFVALKILNPNFEVLEKNMAGVEAKPLKKANKPYKIRREGSFVSGFK